MDDLQRARDKLTGLHSSGTTAGKKRQQIEQGGFVALGGKRNKKPAGRPGASADGAKGEGEEHVAGATDETENGGDERDEGLDLNSLDALDAFVGEDDVFGGLF